MVYASRIAREQQLVFLNQTQLPGVQNVSIQYNNAANPVKYLGLACIPIQPQGEQGGSVSIQTWVIDSDPFIQYTGNFGVNGYVLRSRGNLQNNCSFTSGYLNTYSSRCGIGQIPQIDANFGVMGNIGNLNAGESAAVSGNLTYIQSNVFSPNLQVAGPGSIDLSLDDFLTNRVNSYELGVTVNRKAVYALGQKTPVAVEINWPIEVNCIFNFEIDNYTLTNLRNYPCTPKVKDLTLTLKTFDTDTTINTYNFSDMLLIGESYNTSTDGAVSITAQYRTFIGRPT